MQASSNVAGMGMGAQYEYRNIFHGLKSVVQTDGFKGLYRGASIAGLRVATGSSVQLSTFGTVKDYFSQFSYLSSGDVLINAISGTASGLLTTTAMNPVDVMTTRIYNQTVGKELYTSIPDCFMKIYRAEGIYGFYKGWFAHYLRVGPHTLVTFILLEKFHILFGCK